MSVPTFQKKILPPSSEHHEDAVHSSEMLEARYQTICAAAQETAVRNSSLF
jgi:hypothetical protein